MSIDWSDLLGTISSTALIVAAVAWFAKSIGTSLLEHVADVQRTKLDKDLEAHKAQLSLMSERELTQLRASLEIAATEHRVRFTRLHEQQAEVVAEVFARLERLHLAFRRFVAVIKPADARMEELADEAWVSFEEFQGYYYENAIWLDPETCNAINEILNELYRAFVDMTHDVDDRGYPRDRDVRRDVLTAVAERVPKARGELDRAFRTLLGVEGPGIKLPDVPVRGGESGADEGPAGDSTDGTT